MQLVVASRPCRDGVLSLEVGIRAKTWDRMVALEDAQVVDDFVVTLLNVRSAVKRLATFANSLERWLTTSEQFEVELSEGPHQRVRIGVGKRAGVLCSTSKPAFYGEVDGGVLERCEWSWIVDQTCVRMAMDELRCVLQAVVVEGVE